MTPPAGPDLLGAARVGTWVRDKYFLESVLGSGGMATVYAARHRNKKRFAVKILHPELSRRRDITARFLREGYVANTVEHPGAVAVLDDDIAEDGSAFLVMELLEGASLEALAQAHGGRLPLEVVMAVAHQTLDVLAAAHARNVVHRDIKPANIFLTRDGRVKVLDYGIARLHEGDGATTRTGVAMGTPAFMAPEQAAGRTSLIDGQSDVWSLGATMFALITGASVHQGETPQHQIVLAATQAPRSILDSSPTLPGLASALVDRALAFDKASRWPSAGAMRDAVDASHTALFGRPLAEVRLADVVLASGVDVSRSPTLASGPGVSGDVEPATLGPAGPQPLTAPAPVTEVPVLSKRPPPPSRSQWPMWIGAAALVAIAAALFLRNRTEVRSSPSPTAASPESPGVALDTAAAAPPPTGAGVDPPVTSAAPPPEATVSGRRPPSVRAAASARPTPPRPPGSAGVRPAGPTPTDFDRQ
jgi:serine/threonine protein kinase